MFSAMEGVMMLSQRSLLGSSSHKSNKVTGHWMLMLLTAVSAVLGQSIVQFIASLAANKVSTSRS